MKRLMSLLLALMLLFSLGAVPAFAEDASEVLGAYVFVRAEGDGAEYITQVHEMFASMGMPTTLTLNEDGSAVFSMAGEEFSGVIDFAACTITANGFVDPYVYEDGTLYLDDQDTGATMVFSKDGAAPVKKGVGAFRYFVLNDVLDADGNSVFSDYEEEADSVTATLFPAGDAIMTDSGDSYVFLFDFDSMTYREEGFDESYPFTLEGDVLTVFVGEERVVLTQADPGWAGPYELVDMSEDLAENFSMDGVDDADPIQVLRLMGMLPTLTIEEDGSGTMSLFFQETELQFDFDTMQVSQDGEAIPFTYDKGTLSFGDGETYLSFGRVLALSEDGGLLGMIPGVSDAMPDLGGTPDSAPAMAAPAEEAAPIEVGDIRCELDGDTLTITGRGELGPVEYMLSDAEIEAVRNVVIEKGITGIGDWAFDEWDNLVKVTLPEGLKYINDFAFNECDSLTGIVIPEGVTFIGSWAFDECRSMTAVYLPASLETVDSFAFDDCDKLANVYYGGTEQQWSRISIDSFNDGIRNAEIHFESAIPDLEAAPAEEAAPAGPVTLVVGAFADPHAELLELVKPALAEQGITLEIKIYDDYVLPNTALQDGSLDANFFQHTPYLNDFNASNGTDLVPAGSIYYAPFGIYSRTVSALSALPEGATILVPDDDANQTRALLLLQQEGLIELPADASVESGVSVLDIVNTGGYNILAIRADAIPSILEISVDGTVAVISYNYALSAGYKTADALAIEDASGDAAQTYANIIAVRRGDETRPEIRALVAALQDGAVDAYNEKTGAGLAGIRPQSIVIETPPAPPAAAELTVSEIKLFFFDKELSEFTMRVGDDPLDIQAKISPAEAADGAVLTWSVDDESVLRLTPSEDTHACTFDVLGAKVGGVTVTVSSGDCSTKIRVYLVD